MFLVGDLDGLTGKLVHREHQGVHVTQNRNGTTERRHVRAGIGFLALDADVVPGTRRKRESSFVDQRLRNSEDRGDSSLIQVQATSVFPRFHAERNDTHCGQGFRGRGIRCRRQLQLLSTFGRVEVVEDRAAALGHQREAAVAGLFVGQLAGGVPAERGDRDNQEGSRRDHSRSHHAAQPLSRSVPQAKASESHGARASQCRCFLSAVQPRRQKRKRGHQ